MERILVAIDFSAATPRLIDFGGQLAKTLGAEIHLIHVQGLLPALPPNAVGYGMTGMPELMPTSTLPLAEPIVQPIVPSEADKAKLAAWQNEFEKQDVKVTSHNVVGDVVEEILRTAEATNTDLIVMGRHGHGAMYNLLVGSVTEGVLKRSRWPVLLVPESHS